MLRQIKERKATKNSRCAQSVWKSPTGFHDLSNPAQERRKRRLKGGKGTSNRLKAAFHFQLECLCQKLVLLSWFVTSFILVAWDMTPPSSKRARVSVSTSRRLPSMVSRCFQDSWSTHSWRRSAITGSLTTTEEAESESEMTGTMSRRSRLAHRVSRDLHFVLEIGHHGVLWQTLL